MTTLYEDLIRVERMELERWAKQEKGLGDAK